MKDQPSDSDDEGPPVHDAEYWAHFLDDLTEEDLMPDPDRVPFDPQRPHLITVDELRAAGALDVPPEWRKSLGVERKQRTGLFADEELWSDKERAADSDAESDESADES